MNLSAESILARAQEIAASAEQTEPDLTARADMLSLAAARAEAELLATKRVLWAVLRKRGPALLTVADLDAPANPCFEDVTYASGDVEYRAVPRGECGKG